MLNKVILQGRLTKDPEVRTTANQIAFCTFSVAVERNFKDNNGNREADFINVNAWRNTAVLIGNHFHKGDMILVIGSLQVRKWQDQQGQNRYSTEVIAEEVNFCGGKNNGGQQAQTPVAAPVEPTVPDFADDDLDMPFEI